LFFYSYLVDISFTGAVIGTHLSIKNHLSFILDLTFFIVSLILLVKSGGLEYLVIPTGWEEPRIKKAKEELDNHNYDEIVITGHVDEGKLEGSHRQFYYKELRKQGVKPKQMIVLDGINR